MAEQTYENLGPIYTTAAKYETARIAGTLEDGREYRLVDWEAQQKLTFDSTPTSASTNPVTSGGVYSALESKSTVSVNSTGTATDEVSYITVDGVEKKLAGSNGTVWGDITGTLSNQTDLNNALGGKQDTLTAGLGINIENNVVSLDGNSLAVYDNRISDADSWLTNGYVKTSANIPTANLPPICTGNDRWGVLLYVEENNENHAGLQQYFPIDGTYKGRVFYRSVTGYSSTIPPEFGDWNIVPWSSEKQDTISDLATIRSGAALGATAYQLPDTGIPETDLASSVQTSLGKADTALQSYTETDPTVPSWAKAESKPTYTASEVGADPSGTATSAVSTHNSASDAHSSLFAQKANVGVSYTKAESDAKYKPINEAKRYIVRWDKTSAQCTRMGDAVDITTTTTNFTHNGSFNSNYYNPFDEIYPWSGIKLCNIDFAAYHAGAENIEEAIKCYEGDADFSFTDEWGVWVYVPEFWGKSWNDAVYRYFAVSNAQYDSTYIHYPARIYGRNKGVAQTKTVDGASKTVFLPTQGMPGKNVAMSTLHTYAKNAGMTLDNVYGIDAISLLYIVEFANFNTQSKLGNGVYALYRQNAADLVCEAATDADYVVVNSSVAGYCDAGAILDVGTSSGGAQVGSFIVQSKEAYGDYYKVYINGTATTTTANYTSVHGKAVTADSSIGSMSGYIGTNGRVDAYYRGQVLFSNMFIYILGIYRAAKDADSNTYIWVCDDDGSCDDYDALNTSVHTNTGVVLSYNSGYIQSLADIDGFSLLPVATAVGGSSSAPVGDYMYNGSYTSDRVLILGGSANSGTYDGLFYGAWYGSAANSNWYYSARPNLKSP